MSVTVVTTSVLWVRCPGSGQELQPFVASRSGTEIGGDPDHLVVVYASLGAALDAAVALQQDVERRNRTATAPIAIDIGLSTGDVTIDDGVYLGEPMVEAAGLAGCGRGSEIVTTEMVQLLARRSGHDFSNLGSVAVDGSSDAVDAFLVRWEPASSAPILDLPERLLHVPSTGVVGREQERGALDAALDSSMTAGPRVVFLAGEPGIGKTTLASDLAQRAHDEGSTVLYGRCDEDLGVPYQPFVESLGDLLLHAGPDLLDVLEPRQVGALSRLLPTIRAELTDTDSPLADRDAERYLLFGAVASLLGELASTAPVLLVLDDLHWADKTTVLLLRHLLSSLDGASILVVVTYRDNELTSEHPLDEALEAIADDPHVERLDLRGLDDGGVVALLESMAGHDMDDDGLTLAHSVFVETGGNPFFCAEVLRHLAATDAIRQVDGRWVAVRDLADIGLPESVREVIGQRIRLLGEPALQVLTIASVLGRDFDVSMLVRASTGSDEPTVRAVVALALDAEILTSVDGSATRCTFSHALFQHTLYDELSASRRARVHRRIGELLEDDHGEDAGDRIGELARHWVAATRSTSAEKAIHYARQAGESALGSLAPHEAVRWFRQALDVIDGEDSGDPDVRLDVLIGLGDAQRQAGDPEYRATLLGAGAQASTREDTTRLVAATLANQRGMVSVIGAIDPERIAMLERALAAVGDGDSEERAVLLASLAAELTLTKDRARLQALSAEAEAMARRLDDELVLLRVLNVMFLCRWVPDELEPNLARCAEAVALAEHLGDPVERLRATTNQLQIMKSSIDRGQIDADMAVADSLAGEIGQPYMTWQVRYLRCVVELLSGDVELGDRLAGEALEIGSDSGQPDAFVIYGANLINIRFHQDRLDEILPLIAQSAEDNPGLPTFRAALAMALCECGRPDEARPILAAAAAEDFHLDAYDYVWLTTTTLWAETAASLRDVDASAVLFERLSPYEAQGVTTGASFSGMVGSYLARLAAALGRHQEALDLFRRADERLEAIGSPFWRARNQVQWAEMLLAIDADDGHLQAKALLTEALAIAATHRCPGLLRRGGALVGSLP